MFQAKASIIKRYSESFNHNTQSIHNIKITIVSIGLQLYQTNSEYGRCKLVYQKSLHDT